MSVRSWYTRLQHPERQLRPQSVRRQLFYLMGLLLLVTLIILGLVVYTFVASTESRTWKSRHQEAATNACATVSAFLRRVDDSMAVVAVIDPSSLSSSPAPLRAILANNPALLEIIRLDADGDIIASASQDSPVLANLFSIPQSNWFRKALAGERHLGSVQLSATGEPYLIVAIPVPSGGVVGARLSMTVLWDVVGAIRFGERGGAYVVNRDGQIIAYADHQVVEQYRSIADRPEFLIPRDSTQQRAYVNFDGVAVLGVATPIEFTDWVLYTELPQAEATAVSNTAFLILSIGVLCFGILAVAITTVLLSRLVFHPMEQVRIGAERIGQGDLHHQIPVVRRDEISQVAMSFNTMAGRLLDRDQQIVAQTTALTNEITERIRTEAHLIEARDEAETANRAKSTFLAMMSHELRTPLTAILGYTDLMRFAVQLGDTANLLSDLQKIHTSGTHLLAMISDVLDLSKIEADRMSLFYEPFDVAALMQEILSTTQPLVEKNGNLLVLECSPDIGVIEADQTKVRQVLLNLLSNAAKFTDQGTITLTVDRAEDQDGEWISWQIHDTGIGIAPEQIERLFKPFSQIDDTATRRYGGTGLGLTLSQQFCQLHGGTISVTSEAGRGSVFTARIPVRPQGALAGDATAGAGQGLVPMTGSYLADITDAATFVVPMVSDIVVLVIDDDSSARDLMARFLTSEGFSVVTAEDGRQGLALAQAILPELIILDVVMPELDGWQVLMALKADPELATIPVIMLTMSEQQQRGFLLGAADYVLKPIELTRLIATINRCLQLHHARDHHSDQHILVVEDDPNIANLIRRTLEYGGWQVSTVSSGLAALRSIAISPPDLMILDLMLPEMNGMQVVDELQAIGVSQRFPIVILTAIDLSSQDVAQLQGSVELILQKGRYRIDDLLRDVQQLIAAQAQLIPTTADMTEG